MTTPSRQCKVGDRMSFLIEPMIKLGGKEKLRKARIKSTEIELSELRKMKESEKVLG